ncbi:MAG: hypothetical protein PHQ66_02690 [Candidatus Nanoarchaeia archaeon]|nr:hypothetical protein [Candidatus Nanoarchaeia archaeon]MDD5357725.1 hypothetical protein [Candidatus Nanoarchaeia archaeon]MDD5588644.1 hypothetical protein [Candidatus Nanoarchaeia archaeon]
MGEREIWTPEKRLAYLPIFPRKNFIEEAEFLYNDLLNNRLKVVLIPAPIPKHSDHKIRFAESYNPFWYSGIYHSHNRGRRKDFEKSLWRIVNSLDENFNPRNNKYAYDTEFRDLIYSRLVEGYVDECGSRVLPNNQIRTFFKLDKLIDSN